MSEFDLNYTDSIPAAGGRVALQVTSYKKATVGGTGPIIYKEFVDFDITTQLDVPKWTISYTPPSSKDAEQVTAYINADAHYSGWPISTLVYLEQREGNYNTLYFNLVQNKSLRKFTTCTLERTPNSLGTDVKFNNSNTVQEVDILSYGIADDGSKVYLPVYVENLQSWAQVVWQGRKPSDPLKPYELNMVTLRFQAARFSGDLKEHTISLYHYRNLDSALKEYMYLNLQLHGNNPI